MAANEDCGGHFDPGPQEREAKGPAREFLTGMRDCSAVIASG
jgi:hypothetical protein